MKYRRVIEGSRTYRDILTVLDSDQKIPMVQQLGDYYYNMWHDARHEKGLWRRCTKEEYLKYHPKWETVLDIDELGRKEGVSWVYKGLADVLQP